ncbi:MAG: glucose-1-phosphate cytidylyltransferase [Verrucomicrobia bacterium]|nr:glucose-1-phosphate cytidylyltransferase [Verrucomicrobiota bacterium]MBT7065982.1 glucose-1-phosphate cytidylyltransferase [Verrucomicrobiota bacterium]MBT7699286.1 glucose-1-phosphate cytidylyltransferase [Verrucomicrobiota bacterium]
MKAVILAGGKGTRITEESIFRPKPMIEIGPQPILWHVMKAYSAHSINDFVICCGYKGYMIKEYFANYFLHMADVTFDMQANAMEVHHQHAEPWRVTVVDTGLETMTGGRLKRVAKYVEGEPFCMTYGDGVSDVDVESLVRFHRAHGKLATVTAVHPPARYGALELGEAPGVLGFNEKPAGEGGWINGGFFVLDPQVLALIEDDTTTFEDVPLRTLAAEGQLEAFRHEGFWQCMDHMRDKLLLEEMWATGNAPWKVWP